MEKKKYFLKETSERNIYKNKPSKTFGYYAFDEDYLTSTLNYFIVNYIDDDGKPQINKFYSLGMEGVRCFIFRQGECIK